MIQKLKSSLAQLLESFFRQRLIAQRRASPTTVNSYRDALRLFLVFASKRAGRPPSRLSLKELDRDVVLAFLDHLELEQAALVVDGDRHRPYLDLDPLLLDKPDLGGGGKRDQQQQPGQESRGYRTAPAVAQRAPPRPATGRVPGYLIVAVEVDKISGRV